MEFKFSKDGEENAKPEPADETKKQRAILALLLLLVGGFLYVYFFTGLIKSQEAPKPAEAPAAAQVVKMPLPPRDGDAGKAETKPPEVKKEAAVPAKAEPPKAPAAPVAAAVPAAKTPPAPVKPKEEPKKAEPVKPKEAPKEAPKKAEPVKNAEKKPAVAEKKPEPAKADAKKDSSAGAPKQKAAAAKPEKVEKTAKTSKTGAVPAASGGAWSVLVGTYVLEDALSADMGRVRKAGLEPVVKPGARKKSVMNRLFVSEFADRTSAVAALDKLKRHTSDAFILDHSGKHTVYAGSYLLDARAASETERLSAAGITVSLKRAEIAIPTQSLILGPFKDKKTADSALGKLKAAGVKATLSRQ